MKKILAAFPLLIFLAVLAAPASADYRLRDLTEDLKNSANNLEKHTKKYLKDSRRWEPRGQDRALWQAIQRFEDATDDLHDRAKKNRRGQGLGREISAVQHYAAEVRRMMPWVRSGRVQREWRDSERLLRMLPGVRGGYREAPRRPPGFRRW